MMYLIPLALLIGAAVGLFVRGSFDYLLATRVVFWPIAVVGVALQGLVGSGLGVPYPTLLTAISMVLIAVTCAMNLHLTGASVVLFGTVLNLLPLVFYGYMPVTAEAVVKAGIADFASIDLVRLGATRAFETGGETLIFLGAIVPVRWLNEVFSFGDLVIACGLANLGFRLFFPLRETATYYDEASDYDQHRDPNQPDPFDDYTPNEPAWAEPATNETGSAAQTIPPPNPQTALDTLEGSASLSPHDEEK
ncbi:MAG: hypothetical protein CL462_05730 [Acidimicrobiaceae bacterium]|nr:hypothetical protein [Acidimicrobiaceae bacterium]|tara:strand:- start:3737 stop:4486 length:750 start_codon:yes stop_codon:yes gene_type:complete